MKLAIAYFGSPDFSARFLEKLITDEETKKLVKVKLVVTQPDKPVGRKQILTPTPVKQIALKIDNSLEIACPAKLAEQSGKNCKLKISQLDLALVYAYNQIIPKDYLTLPKYGFWCIHPSLLPKYRGPSPIATALINGDEETGVTIFKMDEKIDHGLIIAQEKIAISPTDLRPDLEKKLTDLAFAMFKKLISTDLNKLQLIPQDDQKATYTKKLKKEDGFIEISNLKTQIANDPKRLFNIFRGLYPWPGIWTLLRQGFGGHAVEKRLKITDLSLVNGKLIIKKVQLEGKKEVDFATFNRAYKVF
jgi:methionyl-tRNA formyltransferase